MKESNEITYVVVSGLGNSGPFHWQTIWQKNNPKCFMRIEQSNWDAPICETWVNSLERQLKYFEKKKLILIGHSLGCLTIVHWFQKFKHLVKGALLVAPCDPDNYIIRNTISGFMPVPLNKLPFNTIVISSTDDPYISLNRVSFFSNNWGSKLITLSNKGHLDSESKLVGWEFGFSCLENLK